MFNFSLICPSNTSNPVDFGRLATAAYLGNNNVRVCACTETGVSSRVVPSISWSIKVPVIFAVGTFQTQQEDDFETSDYFDAN